MKKLKMLVIILAIILLTGCIGDSTVSDMIDFAKERYEENQQAQAENPMAGMDKNEKVLFILHETYPDHSFIAIEPVADGTGRGIYADENGLEFEIYNIIELSTYQFRMDNDYIYKSLMQQDFLTKTEDVVNQYGYEMDFDEPNRYLNIIIDLSNNHVMPEEVLAMVKEVLNSPSYVPNKVSTMKGTGTEFSSGEIKYYTFSDMANIFIEFRDDKTVLPQIFGVGFSDLKYSDAELLVLIEAEYWALFERNKIIYKSESYYVPWEDDHNGREIVDENNEKRFRQYMTYNIPVSFELGFFSSSNNYETYYNPQKNILDCKGFVTHKLNKIDVYSAAYAFELSEKDDFMVDIESNIKNQIGDRTDVEFVSIEEYPDDDHTVIKVQLNEPFGAISKHYYIMGDGMFALVEQTTFTEEEYYDEVTADLIESFKWEQVEE